MTPRDQQTAQVSLVSVRRRDFESRSAARQNCRHRALTADPRWLF
jgi:hypothetical protein